MTFSKKIDKLLIDNNIKNLRQLSVEVNIPYTTLWDYYSNPLRLEKANISNIKKIANRLNCTIDYLVYEDITNKNEIKMDGYDINDSDNNDNNIEYMTKFKVCFENTPEGQERAKKLLGEMSRRNIRYEVLNEENVDWNNFPIKENIDELELLFSKNKDILTDDDKDMIRFVVEKRKREIDKQLGKE